jgi:hypothetical protein
MTTPETTPRVPNPYAYTPPDDGKDKVILVWARIGITLLLIPLGMSAFKDEYGSVPLLGDINAAIHEFGHMLFQPFGWAFFGQTGVVLGGSLTQVAFPCLFVGYFLFSKKHRDIHAAMICLFWVAINLLEVSIYAGDARAGVLQLINGLTGQDEDSGHDFQYLFRHWGVMNKDTLYAGRMRALAGLLCFVSIAVGIWAAMQSKSAVPSTTSRTQET